MISSLFNRAYSIIANKDDSRKEKARIKQVLMVRMGINLPYVEDNGEKLRRIFMSHKIRSTFYTEKTLRKLLCKPKDPKATEDKKISLMKLTAGTVKQSTSVNLNGL